MGRSRKYPDELRERAVRMVFELRARNGQRYGVLSHVSRQLGINKDTLRNWVRAAEGEPPARPAVTDEQRRIAELEAENFELRRSNEILKAASAFFARELDPRPPK